VVFGRGRAFWTLLLPFREAWSVATFLDCQLSRLLNVDCDSRPAGAGIDEGKLSGNAVGQQYPSSIKLWVMRLPWRSAPRSIPHYSGRCKEHPPHGPGGINLRHPAGHELHRDLLEAGTLTSASRQELSDEG
jgi:hypothetical protein